MKIHRSGTITRATAAALISLLAPAAHTSAAPEKSQAKSAIPSQPRIVNLYNFIRNSDYRLNDSENILFDATRRQIALIKPTGLPATYALQYDALINPRYQKLLKEQAGPNDEIAAWWEIPRQLATKAGIKWRGHDHDWDSTANVGFSPGYTPDERRKLVDVYMADFKEIFGYYPKSVGSWFIDEVTLEHMTTRYGIVASCNCKDQVGTDGYTLWGGYWNQAYYPSRVNSYMPAQTKGGQIDVPIFRMLGSDPIYQYGRVNGMFTLEPVYRNAGGSAIWTKWFMKNLIKEPSLAFAYTQAGQENSFGWNDMKEGLTLQVALLEYQSKAGEVQVMTLADSGKWFKNRYPVTPPTSMVALDDWREQDRKTVWYNSRFYRFNCLWEDNGFLIRDIHRFDEKVKSVTHDSALTTSHLAYGTLPIMDGSLWSEKEKAAIRPVLLDGDGKATPLVPEGQPVVKELNATDLGISQPLSGGGTFHIVCRESTITCTGQDAQGKALRWAWEMRGGDKQKAAVTNVGPKSVTYKEGETTYDLGLSGTAEQLPDGAIRLLPPASGQLVLTLGGS